MLKFEIDAEAFAELPEVIQAEYTTRDVDGVPQYFLDADGKSLKEVDGMKSALRKERKSVRELTTKVNSFGELTLESHDDLANQYADIKNKYEALELQFAEAGTTDAERAAQVAAGIEKAAEISNAKFDQLQQSSAASIAELTKANEGLTSKYRAGLLKDAVISGLPENIQPSAVRDIVLNAERDLEYSEDGNDGKGGHFQPGTDLDVKGWISAKIADCPHWLRQSVSGGASGGAGSAGPTSNAPVSNKQAMAEFWAEE